jgi:penicillin-binding protein 1A
MNRKITFKTFTESVKKLFRFIRKKPFRFLLYLILSGISTVLLLFFFTYIGVFGHVPSKKELVHLKNPVTSTIYGSDKKPIAFFFMQNRSNIDSTQLNPFLTKALVATEDVRFYEHAGIDYKSYGRVLIKSVLMQQGKGGGSTITQQIAKNVYGRKELWFLSTPISKMRELIIARRLERIYDKEELLLLYFNTVSFGENLYGIEKASQRFFSKTPEKLNLTEAATLVGTLKAPTYYNPRRNPQNATRRRNIVLDQMVKYNAITDEEAEKAKTELVLKYSSPEKTSSLSGYYKEFIRKEFKTWAAKNPAADGGIYNLEEDGLNIYTTIQPNIQKYAESAMVRNMERLQKSMDINWESNTTQGGKEAFIEKIMALQPKIKQLKSQGRSEDEITAYMQKTAARKYWEIGKGFEPRQQNFQDSVISALVRLHTGILAMNSRSGAILGYLGGIDYGFSQIDNIHQAKQVGSTFKPITYLAALQQGIDVCDFYSNSLRTYPDYENWQPRNSNNSYGGSYSVHGALANSVNTVSVALQLRVGVEKTSKLAEKMGITSTIPAVPSIVLGTADINLMEMVTAYASISNGGHLVTPYMIQKITDDNGNMLYEAKPKYGGRVASEEPVRQLQQMMGEVLTDGSGASIQAYGIPFNLIGKTGTTQNNGDGWFIGASPEVVVGAWVGTQDKRVHFKNTSLGSGARTAMPMVASVFKSLSSWTRPMLTNFAYENSYFNCPTFSELAAKEATHFYKNDSTYIQELLLKNQIQLQDSISVEVPDLSQ